MYIVGQENDNPTDRELETQQLNLLTDYINETFDADQKKDFDYMASALNAKPLINNPVEMAPVNAPPYTRKQIIAGGVLTTTDLKAIKDNAEGSIVYDFLLASDEIDLNDPTDVSFLGVLVSKGLISGGQSQALESMQKIDDPNYQSKIVGTSPAEEMIQIGCMLECFDIKAAINGGYE